MTQQNTLGDPMNFRPVFDALRYPSTQRGVVMFVTGIAVLYNTWFGGTDADVLGIEQYVTRIVERAMAWLGVGMTIVGMLGWLPDRPDAAPGAGFNGAGPAPDPEGQDHAQTAQNRSTEPQRPVSGPAKKTTVARPSERPPVVRPAPVPVPARDLRPMPPRDRPSPGPDSAGFGDRG